MTHTDDIADRYVRDWAELDPLIASEVGIAGYDDRLTDLGPDAVTARAELDRRTLAELSGVAPADDRERAALVSMRERLGISVELHDAGEGRALNVIATPVHAMRSAFDLMPTEGDEAIRNITARLDGWPEALRQYRETLRSDAAAGHRSTVRQVRECAKLFDDWTGASGDDFFAGLVERLGAEGTAHDELAAAAARARESVTGLTAFLRTELLPDAEPRDPVGRDRYALASRYFLGAAVDLAETYAWGWDELARIEADMRRTAGQIAPGGSVDDAVAALDADPKRTIDDPEEFRRWMQARGDEAIAELHGTHFDIPEPVRTIEACIAPVADGGIYYSPPSENFERPGRMWWALPNGVSKLSTWRELSTVYHEGVPGHHLQVGQTIYRRELLNRWQRLLCWVSGSGEGWALYAERLMDDLGYLSDPGARLGMLDAQAFRAARVIVDIGMHLELEIPRGTGFHEGERWNAELGWEFLRAHCRMDDGFLRFELLRYLGWAGQAPAYKVGERIWLAAREDAQRRHGPAFDLKAFHTAALNLGSIGLDPLRESLARL